MGRDALLRKQKRAELFPPLLLRLQEENKLCTLSWPFQWPQGSLVISSPFPHPAPYPSSVSIPAHLLRTDVLPDKTPAKLSTVSMMEAGETFKQLLFFSVFFSQSFIFPTTLYKHRLFIIRRRYFTHTSVRYSTVQSKVQNSGIILFPAFTGKSIKNNWCKSSPTISPLIFRESKKSWNRSFRVNPKYFPWLPN